MPGALAPRLLRCRGVVALDRSLEAAMASDTMVLDALPTALVVSDADGVIRRANRRAFVLWLAGLHCTLTVGTLALLVGLG